MDPLEKRLIRSCSAQNGIVKDLPALDPNWCVQRDWVPYVRPPTNLSVPGAKDFWLERTDLLVDDLDWLLEADYHIFWSQVVHDKCLHRTLGLLLQRLPRRHDYNSNDPDLGLATDAVLSRTFRVLLRMSTNKEEDKVHFMSPGFFAKLIYDHYLFDIPRILDICCVFSGSSHKGLLEKMVANLFKLQPAYMQDLKGCVPTIIEALEKSQDMLENDIIKDVVMYAVDVSVSIYALIRVYNESCQAFNPKAVMSMASFYHCGLMQALKQIVNQDKKEHLLVSRLQLARYCVLHSVRQTVQYNYINPVVEESDGGNEVEDYLHLYTGIMSDCCFFKDYLSLFNLEEDLDIFRQSRQCDKVDPMRVQYLLDGLQGLKVTKKEVLIKDDGDDDEEKGVVEKFDPDQRVRSKYTQVELDSLASQVMDLLPHLGQGFVQLCLEYFDFEPEKVINAVLEDNLPPHLSNADKDLAKIDTKKEEDSVVVTRSNVYDGDEFDINSRDKVDTSRVHRGKKNRGGNANKVLEDKSHLEGLRDRFAALGIVQDEEVLEYDDEYDDTYDENAMGEREPDAMDDLTERRPFVLPRALGGGHVARPIKEDTSEDDEDVDEKKDDKHFARNPEQLRAEAEQRRRTYLANRGRGGGVQKQRDVVGKAKGQGQDKQVLINRSRKNANKGRHQRAMADRKQNKGMF